jgi:uncharacterized Tic20 family protein
MPRDPNYGIPRGYEAKPLPYHPLGVGVGTTTERTWSALAHLSIFLNLFTGFLGPLAAFIIWLLYKDRSERIAFHAMRSMWYQVAWLAILAVGWVVTGILMVVLIGFLLVPVMSLLSLVPFVHAVYAAYKASRGEDYRYLWALHSLRGQRRLPSTVGAGTSRQRLL